LADLKAHDTSGTADAVGGDLNVPPPAPPSGNSRELREAVTVVFASFVYRSREHHNDVNARVMAADCFLPAFFSHPFVTRRREDLLL
jgi:hypothetical protein